MHVVIVFMFTGSLSPLPPPPPTSYYASSVNSGSKYYASSINYLLVLFLHFSLNMLTGQWTIPRQTDWHKAKVAVLSASWHLPHHPPLCQQVPLSMRTQRQEGLERRPWNQDQQVPLSMRTQWQEGLERRPWNQDQQVPLSMRTQRQEGLERRPWNQDQQGLSGLSRVLKKGEWWNLASRGSCR